MPRRSAAKNAFKDGDRVRCRRGPAKGELGIVVERFLPNRTRSISPRPGFLFVLFDRAHGVILDAAIETLEKVRD
jgi:hypothetical protein